MRGNIGLAPSGSGAGRARRARHATIIERTAGVEPASQGVEGPRLTVRPRPLIAPRGGIEPVMCFHARLTAACLATRLPRNETIEPAAGVAPAAPCLQGTCSTD